MKKLAPLPVPPTHLARYEAIRDSKRNPARQVLVDNHAQIAARYQMLATRAAEGALENIGSSPLLAISAELRGCYGGKTNSLLDLKKAIKDRQSKRQLKYCPYCGTTTNETHDHYLPGARFPEFAVNALNLVPCCFRCNTIKDDDWLDAAGRRRYLHFYVDEVPDVDFLRVELFVLPPLVGVGARFRVEQAGMNDGSWRLIRSHFDRLHLIDRYNESANDEIAEMLEDAANFLAEGGDSATAFLHRQSQSARQIFGRNNWRAVLLRALGDHPGLEAWIAAVTVPAET